MSDNLGTMIVPYTSFSSISTSNGTSSKTGTYDLVRGDVNYNLALDTGDATAVLQYVAGTREFSNLKMLLGDYNQDGVINTGDATAILQAVAS